MRKLSYDFKSLIDQLYVDIGNNPNFNGVNLVSNTSEVDTVFPSLVIDKDSEVISFNFMGDSSFYSTEVGVVFVFTSESTSERDSLLNKLLNFIVNYDFQSLGYSFGSDSVNVSYDTFVNSDGKTFFYSTFKLLLKKY